MSKREKEHRRNKGDLSRPTKLSKYAEKLKERGADPKARVSPPVAPGTYTPIIGIRDIVSNERLSGHAPVTPPAVSMAEQEFRGNMARRIVDVLLDPNPPPGVFFRVILARSSSQSFLPTFYVPETQGNWDYAKKAHRIWRDRVILPDGVSLSKITGGKAPSSLHIASQKDIVWTMHNVIGDDIFKLKTNPRVVNLWFDVNAESVREILWPYAVILLLASPFMRVIHGQSVRAPAFFDELESSILDMLPGNFVDEARSKFEYIKSDRVPRFLEEHPEYRFE